jgi:uncharacterized membrane protein YcaP (DUF421 family)
LLEGDSEFLIKNGVLQQKILDKESIDQTELEIAAHKQGFDSLAVIDSAMIDTEGNFSFVAKKSNIDEQRHKQLLDRIDSLEKEIRLLSQNRAT